MTHDVVRFHGINGSFVVLERTETGMLVQPLSLTAGSNRAIQLMSVDQPHTKIGEVNA